MFIQWGNNIIVSDHCKSVAISRSDQSETNAKVEITRHVWYRIPFNIYAHYVRFIFVSLLPMFFSKYIPSISLYEYIGIVLFYILYRNQNDSTFRNKTNSKKYQPKAGYRHCYDFIPGDYIPKCLYSLFTRYYENIMSFKT